MPKRATVAGPAFPSKYGNAEGYDSYMGRWSAALAPVFLDFASLSRPMSLLDVGSGTGNLLAAATTALPGTRLVGVDPSQALLRKARARPELAEATFIEGRAEALPFAVGVFDGCFSLLVLQEFPDRLAALREMRRVTRPGGIVAACVWDFSRMPVIASLVEAIKAVDPDAGAGLSTNSPLQVPDEARLTQDWIDAGLGEVLAGRIVVGSVFLNFNEFWHPLLSGSTPSTLTLAALPEPDRARVKSAMRKRFAAKPGGFSVVAEALVVRGRV